MAIELNKKMKDMFTVLKCLDDYNTGTLDGGIEIAACGSYYDADKYSEKGKRLIPNYVATNSANLRCFDIQRGMLSDAYNGGALDNWLWYVALDGDGFDVYMFKKRNCNEFAAVLKGNVLFCLDKDAAALESLINIYKSKGLTPEIVELGDAIFKCDNYIVAKTLYKYVSEDKLLLVLSELKINTTPITARV